MGAPFLNRNGAMRCVLEEQARANNRSAQAGLMTRRWTTAAIGAAALLWGGLVVAARAETPPQSQNPNAFTAPAAAAPTRKSLQWDANGRWTLKLDMDEPVGRDVQWKDVQAGAFFHITPSLRIGGSVGLGDRLADPQKIVPQDAAEGGPRVHLETKFKF